MRTTTTNTMTHDEAISLLADAPRLVRVGIARGWIKPPVEPAEGEGGPGKDPGRFQEPNYNAGPKDSEMVEWRRRRNASQRSAAALVGVPYHVWQAAENLQAKRQFTLP